MVSFRNKLFLFPAVLVLLVLTLSGCTKENKGELIYTTAEDIMVRMENKETFVVYLGTTTCSFCIKYKAELEDVIKKESITIYGVMINEGNAQNNQILQERFALSGTPQTYWIVEGKISDMLIGYVQSNEVVDWFDKNDTSH